MENSNIYLNRVRALVRTIVIVAFLMIFLPMNIFAEISRPVMINSSPQGAEIYLLQGNKRTAIGKTPLKYNASFHSEISILRLLGVKAGYDPKEFEINAKSKEITLRFKDKKLIAEKKDLKDRKLASIQEKVELNLRSKLKRLLGNNSNLGLEIDRPIVLIKIDRDIYLNCAVSIRNNKEMTKLANNGDFRLFASKTWNQLGEKFLLPIAKELKGLTQIDGLILEVKYGQMLSGFNVGVKQNVITEMKCVGGMRLENAYDPCATKEYVSTFGGRYMEQKCKGGIVQRQVFDPCLNKVPVVRTEFVADPQYSFGKGQALMRFFVKRDLAVEAVSAPEIYSEIDRIIFDAKGKIIEASKNAPLKMQ